MDGVGRRGRSGSVGLGADLDVLRVDGRNGGWSNLRLHFDAADSLEQAAGRCRAPRPPYHPSTPAAKVVEQGLQLCWRCRHAGIAVVPACVALAPHRHPLVRVGDGWPSHGALLEALPALRLQVGLEGAARQHHRQRQVELRRGVATQSDTRDLKDRETLGRADSNVSGASGQSGSLGTRCVAQTEGWLN